MKNYEIMKKYAFIILLLLLMLISCQTASAEDVNSTANEIFVNNGSSIQNAIDNASSGDTIIVNSGSYQENIIINKTLNLKANGTVTLNISNINKPGFYINNLGNNTRIEGFRIIGATSSSGIYLNGVSNCTIYNNNISGNLFGIYLENSYNNQILDNTISSNIGYGIYSTSSVNCLISGNTVSNNRAAGINLNSDNTTINQNNITQNGKQTPSYWHGGGIWHNGNNTTINQNNITQNSGTGLTTIGSNTIIQNNNLQNNTGYGIDTNGQNNTLTQNQITQNGACGLNNNGDNTTINQNNITQNGKQTPSYWHGGGIWHNGNNLTLTPDNQINNNGGTGLSLITDNITLTGFQIYNNTGHGIDINGQNNTLTQNQITNNGACGIQNNGNNTTINQNNITQNGKQTPSYWHGGGIWHNGNNTTINQNNITQNSGTGLTTIGSNTIIQNNNLQNNTGYGIDTNGQNNTLTQNQITNNGAAGIQINGMNNIINNNIIAKNGYSPPYRWNKGGICLISGNQSVINNLIAENTDGITISTSNNTIKQNTFINNNIGLTLSSTNNTVTQNTFINNNIGLTLSSTNNTVTLNNISNGATGVSISTNENFYNNTIFNCTTGVSLISARISGNTIMNCSTGISLTTPNNKVSKNTITNNAVGVYIGSTNNQVSENEIKGNQEGIRVYRTSNNLISENNITKNVIGLRIVSATKNNIVNNEILNNSLNGCLIESSYSNLLFENTLRFNKNGLSSISSVSLVLNSLILNNLENDISMNNSKADIAYSTYDETKTTFSNNSIITPTWEFYVVVLDKNRNQVENASITIKNNNGTIIGQGITNSHGLFKLDNAAWYNRTENSSQAPYKISVILNGKEYCFENNITQRAVGYPAGPLECLLPVIDPAHATLPDGDGDGDGDQYPPIYKEIYQKYVETAKNHIELYVSLPPLDINSQTYVRFGQSVEQPVYITNLGTIDTGQLLIYIKMEQNDQFFNITGVRLISTIKSGNTTEKAYKYLLTQEEMSKMVSKEEPATIALPNIAPGSCIELSVTIQAGPLPADIPPRQVYTKTESLKVSIFGTEDTQVYQSGLEFRQKLNGSEWTPIGKSYKGNTSFYNDLQISNSIKVLTAAISERFPPFKIIELAFDLNESRKNAEFGGQIYNRTIIVNTVYVDEAGRIQPITIRRDLMDNETIPSDLNYEFRYELKYGLDAQIRFAREDSVKITAIGSRDPNNKIGIGGEGDQGFIPYIQTIPYIINFENMENASAPAQKVVILDQLDENFDWRTFKFGNIKIGNQTIPSWQDLVDLRPYQNLIVKINRTIDYETGLVKWEFISIDPDTGLMTTKPLAGFLPPNIIQPEGEGAVRYTIQPKLNLTSGTTLKNKAWIIFDNNDPIETNEVINTIDDEKPTSNVIQLPGNTNQTDFEVSWIGNDNNGSGISKYTIYVSDNNGSYNIWLETNETFATYNGTLGHTYKFFSIAEDNVVNTELAPREPDAMTTIITNLAPMAHLLESYLGEEGSEITFNASTSCDPDGDNLTYRWDFDNDGIWDTEWLTNSIITHKWVDDWMGIVKLEVNDGNLTNSTTTQVTVDNAAPIVNAAENITINEGDTTQFNATYTDPGILDTHTITWNFGDGTTTTNTLNPTHTYQDNGNYTTTLTITDNNGATTTKTLTITVNNLPPIVNPGTNKTINEGDTTQFNATYTDPGILDTHTITWNFGDGTTTTNTLNPTHTYQDNGNYTTTLTITDNDNATTTKTLKITVNNVLPTVNAGLDQSTIVGNQVNFSGKFTDPGVLDTHTITWNFGDGTTTTGTLNPIHKYSNKGNYTVKLTVTDNSGENSTDTLLVSVKPISVNLVIDPDTINMKSNGKWVTAYITLPSSYSANNIDVNSIKLSYGNKSVSASKYKVKNGILVVKFEKDKIKNLFSNSITNATVSVTGKILSNDQYLEFEGSDDVTIKQNGSCQNIWEKWINFLYSIIFRKCLDDF